MCDEELATGQTSAVAQEYKYTRRQISSGNTPTHPTPAALFFNPQKLSSSQQNMGRRRPDTHESKDRRSEGGPPHGQEERMLGDFKDPTRLDDCDIGPPKEIAHYSCYSRPTDNNDGYHNEYEWDHSALRTYRYPEEFLNKSFETFADKEMFNKTPKTPHQPLARVITACIKFGGADSLRNVGLITRRSVLVR